MKCIGLLIACALASVSLLAQSAKIADFPDVGDSIHTYPNVEWLKGNPVEKFDKSKTYIVELWATWCVPCIAAMPHLAELRNAFPDSNIVFIAQDVMEDNKDKVVNFVKNKPELANLSVAFSGPKGSDFDLRWIKAAGVSAIPQTFIIQDNKLLWQTMPYMLNEAVMKMLVNHTFTIDAAKAANGVKE